MKTAFLCLLLGLPASAAAQDYSDPSVFLKPGPQSYISPEQWAAIKEEAGVSEEDLGTIALAGKIYAWMRKSFSNPVDGGASIGKNTAAGLLAERKLYGCTDWALVASSVLRAAGTPALMADAAGVAWMESYRASSKTPGGKPPGGFHGHVFTEAHLGGRWVLIEHNSGMYFDNYDPADPVIPMKVGPEKKGFYSMRKGVDPQSYGIGSVAELNALMKSYALADLGPLKWPRYAAKKLPGN